MSGRVALVTGATGIVGDRLVRHLSSSGWSVIGLSRRAPSGERDDSVERVEVDLRDAAACRELAANLHGVTHVFNAARFDHDTATLESPFTNTEMLANLLDALVDARQPLAHVNIVQGTKYYGSHLGPFPTPAREDAPRALQDNFYYRQQDLLRDRHRAQDFAWSACRPHAIVDPTRTLARSIPTIIAIYATISRELGVPLCFPGTLANFTALYQFTDAGLLARSIEWMATAPQAANQAFNVTNGDCIRWCNVWPAIARYFGMEAGPVRTVRLVQVMADKAPVWRALVERHGLQPTSYESLALWSYGDFAFAPSWDHLISTTKLRRHGFEGFVDTEAMLFEMFDRLRERRVIPAM